MINETHMTAYCIATRIRSTLITLGFTFVTMVAWGTLTLKPIYLILYQNKESLEHYNREVTLYLTHATIETRVWGAVIMIGLTASSNIARWALTVIIVDHILKFNPKALILPHIKA